VELPHTIGSLKLMKRLGIKYNCIEEIPDEIRYCTELEEFNIEQNNVSMLPVRQTDM
jgi:Leucine-rich repeat (LRR) protein